MDSRAVRPYRTARELVGIHRGVAAVVMGGGPSLPEQLERVPGRSAAIYVSANHHGASLVGCDYIVALDKIPDLVLPFGVPVISRHMFGDFRILRMPAPNSGVAAAWIANLMGCSPIHVAGMDLGGAYFYDAGAQSGRGFTRDDHLRHWRAMLERHPGDYRFAGGPLLEQFPSWNIRTQTCSSDVLELELAGVVVEMTAQHQFKGRVFERGELVELKATEAQTLVAKERVARFVG